MRVRDLYSITLFSDVVQDRRIEPIFHSLHETDWTITFYYPDPPPLYTPPPFVHFRYLIQLLSELHQTLYIASNTLY